MAMGRAVPRRMCPAAGDGRARADKTPVPAQCRALADAMILIRRSCWHRWNPGRAIAEERFDAFVNRVILGAMGLA
jgi:hypothetical protein